MTGHWLFFKLMTVLNVGHSSAEHCDRASTVQEREGNFGQSGDFQWLGVLHVQLRDLIATSGIVLIKFNHALVNANDVARIPQHVFKLNSRIMFLATRNTPWFVKPAFYITHPEYEYTTLNSIAIIQLDLDDVDDFPLTPVCLATTKIFGSSRYLYLTGFTHDNEVLEKVIYKIQYLDKKICDEFYNNTELSSQNPILSAYMCGYAPYSSSQCVWDNGMTLVSNEFGYLHLIGFSVHGPGCAVPARFIDLFPYFHWINYVTDRLNYRPKMVSNVPIHDLYLKGSRRYGVLGHHYEAYPYEFQTMKFLISKPTAEKDTYLISFSEKWGENERSCLLPTRQIYRETFEVKAVDHLKGYATYKLSLYDLHYSKCVCVRLTVDCDKRSDAILAFKEEMNFKEDIAMFGKVGDGTPEEIFRHYPSKKPTQKPKTNTNGWSANAELFRPSYIEDHAIYKKVKNYELYITFEFTEWGKLEFEMLALAPKFTTTPIPSTEPTESTNSTEPTNSKETTEPTNSFEFPVTEPQPDSRRAKTKIKAKSKSLWGVDNWADNMLTEGKLSVVTDVEVHELQNAARGEKTPWATVLVGWLLALKVATLRRML